MKKLIITIFLILVPLASCDKEIDNKPLIPDCPPNPLATIADSLQYSGACKFHWGLVCIKDLKNDTIIEDTTYYTYCIWFWTHNYEQNGQIYCSFTESLSWQHLFSTQPSAKYPGWRECSLYLEHFVDSLYYFKFMTAEGLPTTDTLCFWTGHPQGRYYFYEKQPALLD